MNSETAGAESDADRVRGTEHQRLRALVAGDVGAARPLHAEEFQLVTPLGVVLSREGYLGAIAARHLRYLVWELDSPIDIRMYGDVALIRYRSQIQVEVTGQLYPKAPYWFTDAYEKRGGCWQIVWSQGTGIA
jgi:Domain of unknown function (DUF4440)